MSAFIVEQIGIGTIIGVLVTALLFGIPLVKSWFGRFKLKREFKEKEKILEKTFEEKAKAWQESLSQASLKVNDLEEQMRHQNHATLHFGELSEILALGLVKVRISGTKFIKEPIQEGIQEGGWFSSNYRDYYLEVATFSFDATYNVDLANVYVKQDSKGIIVYGLKVGSPQRVNEDWTQEYNTVIRYSTKKVKDANGKEFETLDDTKYEDVKSEYNKKGYDQITKIRDKVRNEFYDRCDEGHEAGYVNDVVLQKAEMFLKGVFAPISKNVEFDYSNYTGIPDRRAVTLKEYCKNPRALEWRD
ncbi:hypothetical protein J5681_02805 [bacterium]|nr:hypothetical protein [bacterium]